MIPGPLAALLCAMVPTIVLSACLSEDPLPPRPALEWHEVQTPLGILNVALARPVDEGSRNHPIIVALPWGSGTAELVKAFVARYWQDEPGARGYYVVAPEILGSSLETSASQIIPALFTWMEAQLTTDATNVALVGASNGGRGAFFAAVANPTRFGALLAMPGMYQGDPRDLAALDGMPVRMIVGEFDEQWVTGTRQTATALESLGIPVEVDIAGTQGHVLDLNPVGLMNWIDRALAR